MSETKNDLIYLGNAMEIRFKYFPTEYEALLRHILFDLDGKKRPREDQVPLFSHLIQNRGLVRKADVTEEGMFVKEKEWKKLCNDKEVAYEAASFLMEVRSDPRRDPDEVAGMMADAIGRIRVMRKERRLKRQCAFLGIVMGDMGMPTPYIRIPDAICMEGEEFRKRWEKLTDDGTFARINSLNDLPLKQMVGHGMLKIIEGIPDERDRAVAMAEYMWPDSLPPASEDSGDNKDIVDLEEAEMDNEEYVARAERICSEHAAFITALLSRGGLQKTEVASIIMDRSKEMDPRDRMVLVGNLPAFVNGGSLGMVGESLVSMIRERLGELTGRGINISRMPGVTVISVGGPRGGLGDSPMPASEDYSEARPTEETARGPGLEEFLASLDDLMPPDMDIGELTYVDRGVLRACGSCTSQDPRTCKEPAAKRYRELMGITEPPE